MKYCVSCETEKTESAFGKRTASPDGLAHKCKQCQKEYDKARNRDQKRIDMRKAYSLTGEGKQAANRAKKKWQDNNIVKRAAHIITGNAIRDGKLIKDVCETCGASKVEAHHDDYSKPLNVRWMCSCCHKQWHRDNGEAKNP